MSERNIIEVVNLTKKYGELVAVNNVSFEVKEGEIFGLLGPNGAGKTTLISMLCTILRPTSGTARVNGFDIVKEEDKVRKSIGIVFQDSSLDNRLTGMENIELHASLYGVPKNERKKRIKEVIELVGLEDKANILVRNYSGGMKRRLEIARALIHYPKVLFLDEPTIGLDPQTRVNIWEYIVKLAKRENITIFLTTHYMEEADFLCNRVAIIDEGKIIAIDSPENLKRKIGGDALIIEADEKEKTKQVVSKFSFVKKVSEVNGKIYVNIENSEENLPSVFEALRNNNIKIKSISVRKPSLNDVFIHYTGKEIRDEIENSKKIPKHMARRL
ncbi:MAG: ATP-binding cassette domain-containing protein [Sulfurihydrogenibium sp.]|nr:ATP-binding cassette domain-containing protein [Sulfurihydrogenibium sp.]